MAKLMMSRRLVILSFILLILGVGVVGLVAPLNNEAAGQTEQPLTLVIRAEKVVSNLGTSWEDWCGATFEFLPDGRMICGELRSGKVRLIENNTLQPEVLIDLDSFSGYKNPGVIDEQGLVGLAIDPNFETNQYVYLHWTYRPDSSSNQTSRQIARFTLVDDQLIDKKVLIDGIPGAKQHVGGPLEFGPDGRLYITGGEAGDQKKAQDPESPLGKTLRINSDGTIPADNPFPGKPYYTMGHRNVFGIGFHPLTGVSYATENGPDTNDEVNILIAGSNYGWPEVIGSSDNPEFVSPIWNSGSGTIAPTELEFYTGDKYPQELVNDLFFMAYNSRSLERIELEAPGYNKMVSHHSYELPPTGVGSYTDIELGPDGYFYVSELSSISKIFFEYTNVSTSVQVSQPLPTTTGTATTITAKIVDQFGNSVANAPLDFFASGSPIGIASTNEDGIASLPFTTYTGGDVLIMASFGGNEQYRASASEGVTLVVEGSTIQPPQILEAMAENSLLVRLSLTSPGGQNDNSTIRFSVRFVDPRTESEIPNIPYVVEIRRENTILFSAPAVSSTSPNLHEHTFDAFGPAEIVIRDINNSAVNVRFGVNVVPEFPVYAALVPMLGFALAIMLMRFIKSRSAASPLGV